MTDTLPSIAMKPPKPACQLRPGEDPQLAYRWRYCVELLLADLEARGVVDPLTVSDSPCQPNPLGEEVMSEPCTGAKAPTRNCICA